MPNIEYNEFYNWIQRDDIVWQPWQILEWKNVTWLRDWYWLTLSLKPTKLFTTNWVEMSSIFWRISSAGDTQWWVVWHSSTNGFIYRTDALDDTPDHSIDSWDTTAFMLKNAIYYSWSNSFYFMWRTANSWLPTDSFVIHKISAIDYQNKNWAWFTYNDSGWYNNRESVPFLEDWWLLYFGISNWVVSYNWSAYSTKSIIRWDVVWITKHGTTFKIYSDEWTVWYWDWVSAAVSSSQNIGFYPQRVTQLWNIDYITTIDWDLYVSWGYDYQLISKAKKSRRLNNNSDYQDKFQFDNGQYETKTIETSQDNIYIVWESTWIYQYGDLIKWLTPWFHKVITQDNTNTDVSNISSIKYQPVSSKLFYTYTQWAVSWVDYIDLSTLTTVKDWYAITPVFRWPPNLTNKIIEVTATTSYTSWDNYIKIYKRIDNWSWVLIRTINDATDVITKHKISTNDWTGNLSDKFLDIQFKIELHNDLQTDIPPILHGLKLEYSIID